MRFHKIILSVAILLFGVVFSAYAAFQEPTQTFPGGTPAAPLDTSGVSQTKTGNLTLDPGNLIFGGGARGAIQLQPGQWLGVGAGFQLSPQRSDGSTLLRNSAGPFVVDALGFRLPNNTLANITSPGAGTLVFDTSDNTVKVFDGAAWGSVGTGGGGGSGNVTAASGVEAGFVPLWSSATNLGTSTVFQSSGGNVGVGTTAPGTKLSVQGNAVLLREPGVAIVAGRGPSIALESPSDGISIAALTSPTQCVVNSNCPTDTANEDNNTPKTDCSGLTVGSPYTDVYRYQVTGGGYVYQYQNITCKAGTSSYSLGTNAGTLEFRNNSGVATLVIGQDGHVGIGKSDPGYALDVTGDANASRLCIAGVCQSSWPSGLGGGGTANYLSKFTGSGTLGNSMIFDDGTSVGIGTTGPGEKLQVDGSVFIQGEGRGLIVDESIGGVKKRVGFLKYSGREAGIWRLNSQDFEIGRVDPGVTMLPGSPTVWTTDLYIAGNGNVGIGTVTPNAAVKLDVVGGLQADSICLGGDCKSAWPTLDYIIKDGTTLPAQYMNFNEDIYGSALGCSIWEAGCGWNLVDTCQGSTGLNSPYTCLPSEKKPCRDVLTFSGTGGGIGPGGGTYRDVTCKRAVIFAEP